MMNIRTGNEEFKQYDVISEQFDTAFIGKALKAKDIERLKKKDKKLEESEFRRRQKILTQWKLCFYNSRLFESKLVISHSEGWYLGVPTDIGTIWRDHLILSPKEHFPAMNIVEEEVIQEIRNYKKGLVAYFGEKKKSVVFLETAADQEHVPHVQIDVIPIDQDLEEDVKKYFKRSLTEDDYEWSTHKKIYDTTEAKGDISKVIPTNFNYFHMDINWQGGFAHVIEDSSKFNRKHVLEVIAGCMGEEHVNVSVPHRYEKLRERVKAFQDKFSDKYDWTKYRK